MIHACKPYYASQVAALFIDARTKTSVVESFLILLMTAFLYIEDIMKTTASYFGKGSYDALRILTRDLKSNAADLYPISQRVMMFFVSTYPPWNMILR